MIDVPAVELRNVTAVYNEGTRNTVVALDDVSLVMRRGEVVVVVGDNGRGKSTLLKVIDGTVPIYSGCVLINGRDVTRWSIQQRAKEISFVRQDPMLNACPNLTMNENFQLYVDKPWWLPLLNPLGLQKNQMELIDRLGLSIGGKWEADLNTLSGGQLQILALCLMLNRKRSIVLLDEFTSALDTATKEVVMDFLCSEAERSLVSVLAVTHDPLVGSRIGKRALTISSGKIITGHQ